MKTKTYHSVGALHPVLFFAVVYLVALVLSIFICSSLFYSCNTSSSRAAAPLQVTSKEAPVLASK